MLVPLSSSTDLPYHQGLEFYQQKNYRSALKMFSKALDGGLYYESSLHHLGLCYEQLGDKLHADMCFRLALGYCPICEAAVLSQAELRELPDLDDLTLSGKFLHARGLSSDVPPASSENATHNFIQTGNIVKIPYLVISNHIFVEAEVNGTACGMRFDPNFPVCMFPSTDIPRYGFRTDNGAPVIWLKPNGETPSSLNTFVDRIVWKLDRGMTSNVYAAHPTLVERIALGPLARNHVQAVLVNVKPGDPYSGSDFPVTLGASFLANLHYSIDSRNQTINFLR